MVAGRGPPSPAVADRRRPSLAVAGRRLASRARRAWRLRPKSFTSHTAGSARGSGCRRSCVGVAAVAEAEAPSNAQERWRRHPESNRGITDLQSVALPLGYAAPRSRRRILPRPRRSSSRASRLPLARAAPAAARAARASRPRVIRASGLLSPFAALEFEPGAQPFRRKRVHAEAQSSVHGGACSPRRCVTPAADVGSRNPRSLPRARPRHRATPTRRAGARSNDQPACTKDASRADDRDRRTRGTVVRRGLASGRQLRVGATDSRAVRAPRSPVHVGGATIDTPRGFQLGLAQLHSVARRARFSAQRRVAVSRWVDVRHRRLRRGRRRRWAASSLVRRTTTSLVPGSGPRSERSEGARCRPELPSSRCARRSMLDARHVPHPRGAVG